MSCPAKRGSLLCLFCYAMMLTEPVSSNTAVISSRRGIPRSSILDPDSDLKRESCENRSSRISPVAVSLIRSPNFNGDLSRETVAPPGILKNFSFPVSSPS